MCLCGVKMGDILHYEVISGITQGAKALFKKNRPHIVRIKYLMQRRFSKTEALSREVCFLPMNVGITESDFL